MHFLNLTVENFGVFRGKRSFDLAPRLSDDFASHLTIFSGHNGAGKTTLFQAMMLALYGSTYLGDVVSQQQYSSFLLSRVHRSSNSEKDAKLPEQSGVTLGFQYTKAGKC